MDGQVVVNFSDLNDYIMLDIFKYLTIKETMRLERMSRRWGLLLSRVWFNRKTLFVTYSTNDSHHPYFFDHKIPRFYDNLCEEEGHRAYETDVMRVKKGETAIWEQCVHRLLARCPNLEVLVLNVDLKVEPIFQSSLGRMCPKLVHLVTKRENMLLLPNGGEGEGEEKALKCLHLHTIRYSLNSEEKQTYLQKYRLLEDYDQLKTLKVLGDFDIQVLQTLLPNLLQLHVRSHNMITKFLAPILAFGQGLEKLVIGFNVLTEDMVLMVCTNLVELKSLQLISCINNMVHLKRLTLLKDIEWGFHLNLFEEFDEQHKEEYSQSILSFLQVMGDRLESLRFVNFPVNYVHQLPRFCSNLKRLYILASFRDDVDLVFESLSKLKKLTHLTLMINELRKEGIEGILKSNRKLKQAKLGYCETNQVTGKIAFDEVIECFSQYSILHPKRSIELILMSYGINFHAEYITVVGNLRVFFPRNPSIVL